MNVAELRVEHLQRLEVQKAQAWARPLLGGAGYLDALLADGWAWAVEDEGAVLGVGGIVRHHEQMGEAWTLLSPAAGAHMRRIHRVVAGVLERCELRRVQAFADPDFWPAQRWLRLLGFEHEGRCRAVTPEGRDMLLFARVRERLH